MWRLNLTQEERKVLLAIVFAVLLGLAGNFLFKSSYYSQKLRLNFPAVNINYADKKTLISLPGIGPKTAAAIISYRNKNGGFSRPKDLLSVEGIGPNKLNRLRRLITTGEKPKVKN